MIFAVRAVDKGGHKSLPVVPSPERSEALRAAKALGSVRRELYSILSPSLLDGRQGPVS